MADRNIALKFGQILRKHRKKAGLTQAQLAKKAGLTPEHVQRLEGKNPSGVRLETLLYFSRAFKISISEFLRSIK